jgi:signal transduction histidine kinase
MAADAKPLLVVVDDEVDNLRTLHDLFRREYRVETFPRAREALEALSRLDPQVVMTDQRMPGMTGVEFLREVKARRPDATRLLFTGYSEVQTVVDAINEGHVFRFISKPWDPDELAQTVRQASERNALLVERRRLVAELQESNARLRESDRLKSAFIEVASHELNTPVAVILGLAELWSMREAASADPAERGRVGRIRRAALRLARTVERMFHLLHADRLEETLSIEATELEPLVRATVEDVKPFLEGRALEIAVEIDPDLGAAEVDPAKLEDVLTNLLVNAVKFTPDGGSIRVRAGAAGPGRVRFAVADTGIGIPAEALPHLFEPFFTGYDTRHHSSGEYEFGKRGIGLGLSLVKRFVEMHGGRVEVESREGAGSTFAFTMPRAHAARGVAAANEAGDSGEW